LVSVAETIRQRVWRRSWMKRVDGSTLTLSRQTSYTAISPKAERRPPVMSRRRYLTLRFGILDRLPNGWQQEHAFQIELGETRRK
jgi:hypothetical protein